MNALSFRIMNICVVFSFSGLGRGFKSVENPKWKTGKYTYRAQDYTTIKTLFDVNFFRSPLTFVCRKCMGNNFHLYNCKKSFDCVDTHTAQTIFIILSLQLSLQRWQKERSKRNTIEREKKIIQANGIGKNQHDKRNEWREKRQQ